MRLERKHVVTVHSFPNRFAWLQQKRAWNENPIVRRSWLLWKSHYVQAIFGVDSVDSLNTRIRDGMLLGLVVGMFIKKEKE